MEAKASDISFEWKTTTPRADKTMNQKPTKRSIKYNAIRIGWSVRYREKTERIKGRTMIFVRGHGRTKKYPPFPIRRTQNKLPRIFNSNRKSPIMNTLPTFAVFLRHAQTHIDHQSKRVLFRTKYWCFDYWAVIEQQHKGAELEG